MPPRVGQPDVKFGDETSTPREAARRLAWFLDEARVEWEAPLIASPPPQRATTRRPCLSGRGAVGSPPNRWHTYRPPSGARYSSSNGWVSRRRPTRFHRRPREYSTPCVLGPCRRVRWRPLTRCFQCSMGARGSSSWKTRRAQRCSHVVCSIYVISNRGAVY
jgi:hypothetical protein